MRRSEISSLSMGLLLVSAVLSGQAASTGPATAGRLRPKTYGTDVVSFVEVPAAAFLPAAGSTYTSDNLGSGPRWATSGPIDFVAPLHLPAGAQVVQLELDYEDNSPFFEIEGSLVVCDFLGQTCVRHPINAVGPPDCAYPGHICSGFAAAPGPASLSADLTGDGIFVNNYDYAYTLYARPQEFDGSTKIAGMIVGYVLQVSPAPSTPRFNDVPVSDPAFQFIEALAASGVSVGCGGGNYCPDAPLTRRQMAVFLAKALGLQFQ